MFLLLNKTHKRRSIITATFPTAHKTELVPLPRPYLCYVCIGEYSAKLIEAAAGAGSLLQLTKLAPREFCKSAPRDLCTSSTRPPRADVHQSTKAPKRPQKHSWHLDLTISANKHLREEVVSSSFLRSFIHVHLIASHAIAFMSKSLFSVHST